MTERQWRVFGWLVIALFVIGLLALIVITVGVAAETIS